MKTKITINNRKIKRQNELILKYKKLQTLNS